jgi:GDP-L-fucose synthase
LIRKFHEAKVKKKPYVVVWGSGLPRREFLHVDDLARACIKIMKINRIDYKNFTKENCSHINVGSGHDLTILELAKKIMKIVGYVGELQFDSGKPDGMKQKLLDSSRIRKLGWKPKINLEDGLAKVYKNFKSYLCKQ